MRLAVVLPLWLLAACAAEPSASITVSGRAAPNVEVVFRSGAREEIAKAGADGAYKLVLSPGTYRVFARDDVMMTVGKPDRVRLPTLPSAVNADALDEALVPTITLVRDTADVDLQLVRTRAVTGTVFDTDARPIMGAVISAHGQTGIRPALGSDIAVSRYDGTFDLQLPDGEYQLAATHAQFADSTEVGNVTVNGGTRHVSLTLVKGCVITGKITPLAEGGAEGAIERKLGASDLEFAPSARSNPDGTFRWTTMDEGSVTLRAWPWHAPPSNARTFNCRDGAVFATTFTVPARAADLDGTLVDKRGQPVPFAHLDIQPLDLSPGSGGIPQQERTDAAGSWAVFAMPPGRYLVTAIASGGIVAKTVTVPSFTERLELSGTGRIEGTTTNLVDGTFELTLAACLDGGALQLPRDPRLVPVANGRFVIADLPACDLQMQVTWKGKTMTARTTVPHAGVARLQLDLGLPREKRVTGVVRDRDGHAVGGAHVVATLDNQTSAIVADEDGKFTLETFAGATINADHAGARGIATVGLANVASERVEIVISR